MDFSSVLEKCQIVSVYLGNTCNFNCSYCDRDYIENSIGSQGAPHSTADNLENFLFQIYKESTLNIKTLAFHGGEPFKYVKRMDQVLDRVQPYLDEHNLDVLITTNGSLILENEWFVRKWAKYLRFTFSYDFIFQEENRGLIDVDAVGKLCEELDISIMWQFVMPITDPRAFSLDLAKDIIEKAKYSRYRTVNLIPLRHHRGADKFKVFLDNINLYKFSENFTQFINTLFNYNVRVMIDGAYRKVDKDYTGKHYKVILSPDGYIYPEYDFVEYQTADFRVGQWINKEAVSVVGSKKFGFVPVFYDQNTSREDQLIFNKCKSCSVRAECGLKYLYKLFDKQPGLSCVTFYQIINSVIEYVGKLNTKNNFYNWINKKTMLAPCEKAIPDDPKEFKSHFLVADNIFPVKQELTFSMLRRYNCYAGCEVCYVDKFFEKDMSKFSRFIPEDVSYEIAKRWVKLFENYQYVTTNDDMYWLKHNHPNLYGWYKDHASLMHFGSLTDNSFVRSADLIVNDIATPRGIYEISFSDKWLAKVNFEKMLPQLDAVQRCSPIEVIKFIQSTPDSHEWPNSKKLFDWVRANDITIIIHHNILESETVVLYRKEQAMQYASYDQQLFTVCGESDFLQYDSFFLTQVEAIQPSIQPYDVLDDDFTITRHISRHLKGKQDTYTRYYTKLQQSTNPINQKFVDYFKFVAHNMTVNDNYNYIPNVSVRPYENIYKNLLKEGWTETNLGLYHPTRSEQVVPLYQFKKD